MRAAIITAIVDGYDTPKPVLPQEGVDVDWVLVTDRAETAQAANDLGWRVVVPAAMPMHPTEGALMHPNLAAKWPKMLPWIYTSAPSSVWVDASFRVTSPVFAREALELASGQGIAQFGHPARNCIYAEGAESARLEKYRGLPMDKQLAWYRRLGHPEAWGLWATGVIAAHHNQDLRALGNFWLNECTMWSFQDQLSEAFVLRVLGLRPALLTGSHWSNPWLNYEASGRHITG